MGTMMMVKEVAARLKLAPSTVYGMIDQGQLPGYRLGNSVRVDSDELEAWLKTRKTAPASPPPKLTGNRPGRPKGPRRDPRWYDAPEDQVYTGLGCLSRNRVRT